MLTLLGTVLGVGAFTAILGLTTTTSGQVSADFTALSATTVTVEDVGNATTQQGGSRYDFPADADQTVARLHGVVHDGIRWQISRDPVAVSAVPNPSLEKTSQLTVYAATPGYLEAIGPALRTGVLFNSFHNDRTMRVAVLGGTAAAELHITSLANQPAVFLNGTAYAVVGVLSAAARDSDSLLGVIIPAKTAMRDYGLPQVASAATMLIQTRIGAAQLVARQAPAALRPDDAGLLQAVAPPDPHSLKDTVTGNLNSLFLMLAGITLAIGAVGIANTTMTAVLERTEEIGLRRSLGARPHQVAAQFLTETALLGTVGGLIGSGLGIATVVAVAISHHWTAVLDPVTTLPAPLIGTVTGVLAGVYPALRAARIEPIEALRR
jgi:putative ABC transport system permease protein